MGRGNDCACGGVNVMAKDKKELTPEQRNVLKSRGLRPESWIVLTDCPGSLLIRNIVTQEARLLYKQNPWARVRH